jgi:hypothetical protein
MMYRYLDLKKRKLCKKKDTFGFPHKSINQIKKLIDLGYNVQIVIGHTSIYEIFNCHRILIKFCGLETKKDYLLFESQYLISIHKV